MLVSGIKCCGCGIRCACACVWLDWGVALDVNLVLLNI